MVSMVACTGWEAQDASLLVAFASTARQIMTAELPTRCFLNRGRPSNSDVSKKRVWRYP